MCYKRFDVYSKRKNIRNYESNKCTDNNDRECTLASLSLKQNRGAYRKESAFAIGCLRTNTSSRGRLLERGR